MRKKLLYIALALIFALGTMPQSTSAAAFAPGRAFIQADSPYIHELKTKADGVEDGYIILHNPTATDVYMDGWYLASKHKGRFFTFPDKDPATPEVILAAGVSVTMYQSHFDPAFPYTYGSGWDSAGDTVYLMNGNTVVHQIDYSAPATPDNRQDALEPNDSPTTASVLARNASYAKLTLHLDSGTPDVDWFQAPLSAGDYTITINADPAIEAVLSTYTDPAGSPIDQRTASNGSLSYTFSVTDGSAPYYFMVRGAHDIDYSPFGSYSIALNAVTLPGPVQDNLEPNNSADTATSIVMSNAVFNDLTIHPNDEDWFKAELPGGKYTLAITPARPSIDLLVAILDSNQQPKFVADPIRGYGNAIRLQFEIPAGKTETVFFRVFGSAAVDYSQQGTYSFSLSYVQPTMGVEDPYEPNNEPGKATAVGYSGAVNNLTLFSYTFTGSPRPDVDWFKVYIPKDMDWHCDAKSSDTRLDLGIHAHVEGKEDMGEFRTAYFQNFSGVSPRLSVHNLRSGTIVYLKVYLENEIMADSVGNLTYTLECGAGSGEPEQPAPTPQPTKPPSSSTGGNPGGSYAIPPTPTPQPSSYNFIARQMASVQPTSAAPQLEFMTTTFRMYTDENNNNAPDPDEWINGVVIMIVDSATGQVVQTLKTDGNGPLTLTLTKQQQQSYRYAIPLLNINRPLDDEIVIVPTRPDYPMVIP